MDTEFREETIDLRDYLRVLTARRWVILSILMVTVLVVAVKTFTATPIFQATSLIVIERETPNLISIQEVMSFDSNSWEFYQTQYRIIESRTVAREVIERLDLASNPEFYTPPDDTIITRFRGWISGLRRGVIDWFKSLIKTGEDEQDKSRDEESEPDSGLVSAFLGRVRVDPIRDRVSMA